LLEQALTHSSWVPIRSQSNERLEFLGDSVFGLAIATTLYKQDPETEEGEMARVKAFVVSRASCAQVAEELDLGRLILEMAPAPPHRRKEAAASSTVRGNVLEALMGAIYLAHGFEQTRLAVAEAFQEQIRYAFTAHVDHKTTLQELLASCGLQPAYRLVAEAGPPHLPVFTSEVSVGGVVHGRGTGATIKTSEQEAAREALASLGGGGGS
jgi:ribonuclease-3